MKIFSKKPILITILRNAPIILLFISVLNEFDLNYLELKYFSFNFPFILIFYWSLKKSESLGYGYIFLAGLFNDVVVGLPIGISSFSYLLISGFASYLRNITLSPNLIKDWIFFLFTILVVNSTVFLSLTLLFLYSLDYYDLVINIFFTFLFYIIFANIFKFYQEMIFGKTNDQ